MTDALVMRIGLREVAHQYPGMQGMAKRTSQLSRNEGIARRSKGSGVIWEKVSGLGRLRRAKVSNTL